MTGPNRTCRFINVRKNSNLFSQPLHESDSIESSSVQPTKHIHKHVFPFLHDWIHKIEKCVCVCEVQTLALAASIQTFCHSTDKMTKMYLSSIMLSETTIWEHLIIVFGGRRTHCLLDRLVRHNPKCHRIFIANAGFCSASFQLCVMHALPYATVNVWKCLSSRFHSNAATAAATENIAKHQHGHTHGWRTIQLIQFSCCVDSLPYARCSKMRWKPINHNHSNMLYQKKVCCQVSGVIVRWYVWLWAGECVYTFRFDFRICGNMTFSSH